MTRRSSARPASRTSVTPSNPGKLGKSITHASAPVKNNKLPSEPDPEQDIYVVESLLECRAPRSPGDERHFLVKWLNYPASDNSWEPESNVSRDLVVQWDRKYQKTASSLNISNTPLKSKPSETEGRNKSKAKKRVLPSSPKSAKKPPTKEIAEKDTAEAKAQAAKEINEKRKEIIQQQMKKANYTEYLATMDAKKIIAAYRETTGNLHYFFERNVVMAENIPEKTSKDLDDKTTVQIVSSEVFDLLWPSVALEFFESQFEPTVCKEKLEIPTQKEETRGAEANGFGDNASKPGEKPVDKNNGSGDGDENDGSDDEDDDEIEEEFEVEKVIEVCNRGNKRYYFLKWLGYSESENTWEPEDSLNCADLLDAFWESRPEADPRKKRKPQANNAAVLPATTKKPKSVVQIFSEKSTRKEAILENSVVLIEWQSSSNSGFVPYKEVRERWPLMLLRYYQSLI